MRKILILAILSIFLVGNASASYIPKEYQKEAKTIKNDVQLYQFGVKYLKDSGGNLNYWAYDVLRQLAQNYTNNGKIASLHDIMREKFKVNV